MSTTPNQTDANPAKAAPPVSSPAPTHNTGVTKNTTEIPADLLVFLGPIMAKAFWSGYKPGEKARIASSEVEKAIADRVTRTARLLVLRSPLEKATTNDINEAKLRVIETITYSIDARIFLLASKQELLDKYYPDLDHYLWNNGSLDLTFEFKDKHPYLVKEGKISSSSTTSLCECFKGLIDASSSNSQFTREEALTDAFIFVIMALTWKGINNNVISGMMNYATKYDTSYSHFANRPKLMDFMILVLRSLPNAGQLDLNSWFSPKYMDTQSNPKVMIEDYVTNCWTKMHPISRERAEMSVIVDEKSKIRFLAKVKEIGCSEEDFWGVRTRKDVPSAINAIQTAPSTKKKYNKWLTRDEDISRMLLQPLIEDPSLCRNCFHAHKLKDCPTLKEEAKDNPAAWIVSDYEEQTGLTRNSYLKEAALQIAKKFTAK